MEAGVERKYGAPSEEIRARRKHEKQQKKLERKTKKEEEFLRDLRKPKDTKVILADRSFLEKLANEFSKKPTTQSFELSKFDFPDLSSPPTKKNKAGKAPTCANMPVLSESSVQSTTEEVAKLEESRASAAQPVTSVIIKRRKTKDPTVQNLEDLIVRKPAKKKKKQVITSVMKLRRMQESNTLCGNMLDSSNPKRSRGKHREIEKRTFTKLKLAIIRDRIISLKANETVSKADEMDREKFKLELDSYLNDLMGKLKLAKAERAAKLNKTQETKEVVPEIEAPETAKKKKNKKTTKYRKYCDNKYFEELDKAVYALIESSVYLQDRAFMRNPIKAKAKPRNVVGLREVKKCLMLHKLKMVIVAPDLEAKDTVFNLIGELKNSSQMQYVPCVFALSRRQLGYVSKKNVPVSAFGIISYDGLEDKFAAVKEKLKIAQDMHKISQSESSPSTDSKIPEC